MYVLNKVTHYQKKIERNKEHTETLLHCINKLHKLPITVRHLEKTGIGKTINELRKFDGDVGKAVKALVRKWKRVVFIETVTEEHAKKERDKKNPIVSNSDESVLSALKTEEGEKLTHTQEGTNAPRATTKNDGTEMLQQIENAQICSIANLNCNDSEYESLRCDQSTLNQSTEGEKTFNSSTENISYIFTTNQSSPKTEKQKNSHHHRHSKHHACNRRDKPKLNKNGNEVDRSELRIKEDDIKIKLEKIPMQNENNKRKERNSGSSSRYKHCRKRAENEIKYSESKKREQKRKIGISERSIENFPKQSNSSKKIKDKIAYYDNIDYFGEALSMDDTMENKRSSSTTSTMRSSGSKSSPGIKARNIPFSYISGIIRTKPDLYLEDAKLESLDADIDLVSMLSETSPEYKPLPHLPLTVNTPTLKYDKQVPMSKQHRQSMKVYSGVKKERPIPTLYDLTVHVLKENIAALEYTGGVPYDILKPILQQATPEQLFQVEYYNPYLIEDTNELWEFHCRKEFRFGQLQPMETAREMYLRCLDEREAKFKSLTCNIQQSLIKSSPVRKTKLAYVDSDPKPPPDVAKKQSKFGIESIPKCDGGKTQRKASALAPLTSTVPPSFLKKAIKTTDRTKPRLAPLMQKTMKLAKKVKWRFLN